MPYVKRDCVVAFSSPDDYRGDMSCVRFSPKAYCLGQAIITRNEQYVLNRVFRVKDDEFMGELLTWHGNNGSSSKVAAQKFIPAEGVTVICGD